MQNGQEVELRIETTGFGGDGIGRLDGMVVFVRGALPGEQVRVRLTKVQKRFAHGALLEVVAPSALRVTPACPLAADCPGCSYQQVAYEGELACKAEQLQGLLAKLGGLPDAPVGEPIGANTCEGYRNKIVLHSDGAGALGYFGLDNRTILDVPCCPLAVPALQEILPTARMKWKDHMKQGDTLTLRWTEKDGAMYWLNREAPHDWLHEKVGTDTFLVPGSGFWQVNPGMTPRLVDLVQALVRAAQPQHLLDLYCGAGLFGLTAAEEVEHVLGVELQAESIRAARANAAKRGMDQVMFAVGESSQLYPEAMARVDGSATFVIVDPPRAGLARPLCAHLADPHKPGPQHLLYISCSADTLARDLKQLCADVYAPQRVQLLDLFPRTAHFETVVLLQRNP